MLYVVAITGKMTTTVDVATNDVEMVCERFLGGLRIKYFMQDHGLISQ